MNYIFLAGIGNSEPDHWQSIWFRDLGGRWVEHADWDRPRADDWVADLERALKLLGPRLYQLYGQGESPMTITGLTKRMHGEQTHPRWRERLGDITAPTLVLHGEDDPFFPIGNGQALAAEIPDARLVRLSSAGHRLPAHAIPIVADELITHTAA